MEPPDEVTQEVFARWRDARRGTSVAEELSNPYWAWLIRSKVSTYGANEHFRGPSSYGGNAAWAAQRFGQSDTVLPDGRRVLVAGEHEDYYDPDFFIYNDVIVIGTDGNITILGYPAEVFPPTDFHSATLHAGKLLILGNLGYPSQRVAGQTQLLLISVDDWSVAVQPTTGDGPGWIHEHQAQLQADGRALLVTGGKVHTPPDGALVENIDDWQLDLTDWTWTRLTERKWPLFELCRADGKRSEIWEMRQAIWHQDHPDFESSVEYPPPADREAFELLYRPATVAHQARPEEEDSYSTYRIEVSGIVVRYEEYHRGVRLTVEGHLPADTVDALVAELLATLKRATGHEHVVSRIR